MIRTATLARVGDSSEVAGARRAAVQCAESNHLGETAAARVALAATELATNLVKHGGGGSLLVMADRGTPPAVTLIAVDRGKGIPSLAAAMQDGHSTAGSPGTGLGAIRRSADDFDVYTQPGRGTAILCRIAGQGAPAPVDPRPPRMVVGGLSIAKTGELRSGDAWLPFLGRDVVTIAVADGLGHGDAAADAAVGVLRAIAERPDLELPRLFETAHGAVRATRGAAVGVARVLPAHGRVDFAGVGNIAGTIVSDDVMRKTVSLGGIVGHEMRKVQVFSYPWTASSVLILQSDGISTNWSLQNHPGILQRDPALIAAVLFRDFCRGTDDATVVVAKATR